MSNTSKRAPIFIVSACLIGINIRYNGENSLNKDVLSLFKKGIVIPICPEILGGLGVPRPKSTIKNDRVINEKGLDVTKNFEKGATEFLNFVKKINPDRIYLKEHSPSCGVQSTSINWKRQEGCGITTKLLINYGYKNIYGID